MKVELISGEQVEPALREAWQRLQAGCDESPFFAPDWVECVAEARDDVCVAVIEGDGELQGFLPVQRQGLRARPVGGPLCDFQGLVGRVPSGHDLADVLAGVGIASWYYDHLLLPNGVPRERWGDVLESPCMGLEGGFEVYAEERRAAGSKQIRQIQRKLRKLEREVGPLRFEWEIRDAALLETLFDWKAAYYARQETTDRFAHDWIRQVIASVLARRAPGFHGLLSGLWAGDRLVALHMGMRSEHVLHYWFPTYDLDYGRYSPGLGLLLELARRCGQEGITRLDLGRGDERYKSSLASGALPIVEGVTTARSLSGRLLAGYADARARFRRMPLLAPLRRVTRSYREAARFR